MEPGRPTDLFPQADGDRPPYSYKELIVKAFELVKSKPLELRDIYFLISGIFPYYKPGGAWQTAVRHVLLSDPLFSTDIKTNYWRINDNISYTSQLSHNTNNFENRSIVSTSTLLTSNTISSSLHSGLPYYRSLEDPRISPYSQYGNLYSCNELTVPSFTTNQSRMSSYAISTNWQSDETYSSNSFTKDKTIVAQVPSSEGSFTDNRFLNQPYFKGNVQPVRPNVIRAVSGSCENFQNKFSPFSANANSDLSLKEGSVKLDFTTKKPNEGSFSFYNAQNSSSDCRYAGMLNKEPNLDLYRNMNSRNYSESFPPIHSKLFSHPQNNYRDLSNNFLNSFYDVYKPFNIPKALSNEVSNQLISVNIHPPQFLYQNQRTGLNYASNPGDLQHERILSSKNGSDASFTNHAVSNIIDTGCRENMFLGNSSVYHESLPTHGFVNEYIRSLSTMPQPVSLSQNLEPTTQTERKEANSETSLININIHLSSLENTNKSKILSKKLASDTNLESISSNHNATYSCTVPDIVNQPISSDCYALCPPINKECTESQGSSISEFDSIIEITRAIPEMDCADSSVSNTYLNKSGCEGDIIATSGPIDRGVPINEPNTDIMFEKVNTLNSSDAIHLKHETSITVQDKNCSLISKTSDELAPTSSCQSIVDNCVNFSEKETSSNCDKETHSSKESALTPTVQDKSCCLISKTSNDLAPTSCSRSIVNKKYIDFSEKETSSNFDKEKHSSKESALTPTVQDKNCCPISKTSNDLVLTSCSRSIVDKCVDWSEKETYSNFDKEKQSSKESELTPTVQEKNCCPISKTSNDLVLTSCSRSIVDKSVDWSEKETSSNFDQETHSSKESLLTTDSRLQRNSDIESTDIPVSISAEYIPVANITDWHILPLLNSTSKSLFENSASLINAVNSINDSEFVSLEALKRKHKVKECHIILKRIKLVKEKPDSNSEPCKKLVDEHFTSNDSSQNLKNENLPSISGNNSLLQGENSGRQVQHSNVRSQGIKNKVAPAKPKRFLPQEINGFTRPSYNYCRLITQALASLPEKKATALEICDVIAKKHSYYEHLTSFDWKSSIHAQLRTRKKFFTNTGTNEKNEPIWSFNPTFEKFMFDKWVPKYVQDKKLFHNTQQPQPPESSDCSIIEPVTTSSESLSPVIVFSGSLISETPANTILSTENTMVLNSGSFSDVPVGSEVSDKSVLTEQNIEDEVQPCGSQANFNDKILNYETQSPDNLKEISVEGSKQQISNPPTFVYQTPYHGDFALENVILKTGINEEEVQYRMRFNADHPTLEKFRLHCTVCDDHLGTSGSVCSRKTRMHPLLGTLVCANCYAVTCVPKETACQWCGKLKVFRPTCVKCGRTCCKVCVERNFGLTWSVVMLKKKDWLCFLCDLKQIWPHRAIAYFLFRHYRNVQRVKAEISKLKTPNPRELSFFFKDVSNCCKSASHAKKQDKITYPVQNSSEPPAIVEPTQSSPVVSESVTIPSPSTHTTASVWEQPPKYIYVQASTTVPSVTLNTGTQYINNVFPEKNYFVVNNSVENRAIPAVNASTLTNTILYSQTPSTINPLIPVYKPPPPAYTDPTPQLLSRSPLPPYCTIGIETNPTQGEAIKEPVPNTLREAKGDLITPKSSENNNQFVVISNTEFHGIEPDESIIIPDVDLPIDFKKQDKVFAAPITSARERIERRPMPKSKKQSLLRTVLMCESIESMKRQFKSHDTLTDNREIPESSPSPNIRHTNSEHMEEPILKSIIETATERLLNLQRSQIVSSSSGEASLLPPGSSHDTIIDLDPLSLEECNMEKNKSAIPKIKIKTLKELQDPNVFCNDPSTKEKHTSTNKNSVNEICDSTSNCKIENIEPNKTNLSEESGINITDLKQSIIEAVRTLINTQKQFKELAKVISSNLIYKPDKTVELITTFHDILKICHQELDQIGGNVKQKFGHLLPHNNIDSILKKVASSRNVANPQDYTVSLQKRSSRIRSLKDQEENCELIRNSNPKDSELDHSIEPSKISVQEPVKRKRVLVDFNPLGKKVILGSPDVTEEDLRRIPNTWDTSPLGSDSATSPNEVYLEELRRYQYLAKKVSSRKKNIWLSTKRKKRKYKKHSTQQLSLNVPLVYNEDGTLMKKRKYKKRRKRLLESDDDDFDETYESNYSQNFPRKRGRPRKCAEEPKALRLSARRHPSTAAHVAQLTCFQQRGFTYSIKPCSVVLNRLDPKIVQVLTNCSINTSGFGEENCFQQVYENQFRSSQ